MGIAIGEAPVRPALDLKIDIPINGNGMSRPPKAITPDEANRLFGVSQAVKMNFVPQMIVAVALDQASLFVNYCRDKRLSEFKKHNRLIKQCVEEYAAGLKESYGPAFSAYAEYVERYMQAVEVDRFKMWCSIGNVANRQLRGDVDRESATHIAIIHNLIDYAERYDRKMDKVIADKLHTPVRRRQDQRLRLITAMCIEFEETWGFRLEQDPIVDANMLVLANRAAMLADSIIGEESNVSKS